MADPRGISRRESRDMGAFMGKILSAMRSDFGCHAEKA
jgi:6-phosphogluconate dehydrogenase (decarboxylating)